MADIDAWRLEARCPAGLAGWPGWLAGLAGWFGWLGWLGWMEGVRKFPHARRSEEVGGFFFIGAPTRALGVPQAATGRHRPDNLLAPTAPGGAAKHATNPSNIDDMATFPTDQLMGRLWDDHFRDLGPHGSRMPFPLMVRRFNSILGQFL